MHKRFLVSFLVLALIVISGVGVSYIADGVRYHKEQKSYLTADAYDDGYSKDDYDDSDAAAEEPKEPEVVTEYVKLSDTVTKQTTTTTRFDTDGDGTFDEEDDHPTINNFFIVPDENRNGIVDSYE